MLDVGGVPNLVPLPKLEKLYDMKDFPEMCDMFKSGGDECLIVGAGAAPYTFLDRNAEASVSKYLQPKTCTWPPKYRRFTPK